MLWIILIFFSLIVIVAILQLAHNNKNETAIPNSGANNQFSTRPGYVRIDIYDFTANYSSAIPQDKFIMLQKMIMQGCRYAEIPKEEYNAIIAKRKEIDKIINPNK